MAKGDKDPRDIYVCTDATGNVLSHSFVWASSKSEALSKQALLNPANAHKTKMRRVPDLLAQDLAIPEFECKLVGNKIQGMGVEWDIANVGTAKGGGKQENNAPEHVVKDQSKLDAAIAKRDALYLSGTG